MHPEYFTSVQILQRTPQILQCVLNGFSDSIVNSNEGPGTWSPFEVVGHLVVCEQTNFMHRILLAISDRKEKVFTPMDMTAHLEAGKGKTIADLLNQFSHLRQANLDQLQMLQLSGNDFEQFGIHPLCGKVTVGNLLSTWVAHDLSHIAQIVRVIAKLYKKQVGPLGIFLRIMN